MKTLFKLIIRLKWFEDAMFENMNAKATEVLEKEPKYTFCTKITAIDPKDRRLKEWDSIKIQADSWEEAERMIEESGMGFCEITGRLLHEDEYWKEGERPSLN